MNGKETRCTVMECIFGKTGENMKEDTSMTKSMGLVSFTGQTGSHFKDNGFMERDRVKED